MGQQTLTRDQVLATDDRKPFAVFVKEWDGDVYVRPLSGKGRQFVEDWFTAHPGGAGGTRKSFELAAAITMMSAVTPEGAPMFVDTDKALLLEKHGNAIDALSAAVLKASGMTVEAREETEGNLNSDPTAGSTSS